MAYAVLVSFARVLDKLQLLSDHPSTKSDIESCMDHLKIVASFLARKYPESAPELDQQLIGAIYEAQDIIESHMSSLSLSTHNDYDASREEDTTFAEMFQKVWQIFGSIVDKASRIVHHGHDFDGHDKIDCGRTEEEPSQQPPFVLSRFVEGNKKFVGREDELMKIKDQLIGISSSELKLVAVVGMIGIGKTALVNEVYNDPLVGNTFDYQAWVSVGPGDGAREILLSLVKPEPNAELTIWDLRSCVREMLMGRRYLIVFDDMRDIGALKKLRILLPQENNGSCIIVTTRSIKYLGPNPGDHRQQEFARDATNMFEYIHETRFLNEDESWDLLRYAATGEEVSCPPQLMKIGKTISQDCQGLPLKIIVLGSLLSRVSPDPESWSTLADNRKIQNDEMLKVTQDLHQEKLRVDAKAPLFYMVAFPQYQQISVSKLFKLWIAEDFFEPTSFTSEELAKDCLQYLVDRSLVLVHEKSSTREIKTCSIHSAIWPFYGRAAAEYMVLQSIESCKDGAGPSHRRFSIYKNVLFGIKDVYGSIASVPNMRSLLFTGPYHPYPFMRAKNFTSFKLLKVLDANSIRFYKFPVDTLKLVLLRFLGLTLGIGEIPTSVSNLAQLQFLIVQLHSSIKSHGSPCFLPTEIWSMKELRHLQVMGSDLPAPPFDVNALLPNLLTLSDVSSLSCTKEILERIPNLKKLGIRVELPWDAAAAAIPPSDVFYHLEKLENLKYVVMNPVPVPVLPPDSRSTFPFGLKKLNLSGSGFSWENMKEIARLPYLVVLKLRCHAFTGPEWEANEDKFSSLNYLLLEDLDIEHWRADGTNFPKLGHLAIHHCYKLHEIPLGLGQDDVRLEKIELVDCGPCVVDSAMRIKEKQRGFGKEWLQVSTHSSWTGKT